MRRIAALVLLASGFAVPEHTGTAAAADRSSCEGYVAQAMQQVKRAHVMQCGFTGDRWTYNYRRHRDWCLITGKDEVVKELNQRNVLVQRCGDRKGKLMTQPAPTSPVSPPGAGGAGDRVPAHWAEMLAAHNEKRKLHCVAPLTWSAKLAADAQAYALRCELGVHGSSGENLATAVMVSNGVAKLPAKTHRQVFQDSWYSEIKDYEFNIPRYNQPGINGHFTQILWKDSTQLGCGIATCKMTVNMTSSEGRTQKETHDGTQWVCRYAPAGNMNVGNPGVLRNQVKPATCN